jgi:hypothetical protein
MNDHIPDVTKMISDTPRMEAALFNAPDAGFANIWKVGCDIERELATAQDRIRLLVAERNTARLQADQKISLREEFRELLGTDEIEQGVVVVRGLQERIKRLEEAGDVLCAAAAFMGWHMEIEKWRKAKEAKP